MYGIINCSYINNLTKEIEFMEMYPRTVTYDGKRLIEMKKSIPADSPLLISLRKRADKLLGDPPLAVVYRKLRAASGNVHDYMSMGPYWWPNPNTPDGLPYIRRDGEINPETNEKITYGKLADSVHMLALAAFYFDEARYAAKAVKQLICWHLDPDTYMTPHLEYGQSIPGICTGRGIGLIDFSASHNLFNGVAILEYLGMIDGETLEGIKKWYVEFVDWMLTSETGNDENNQHNNHGAWFDVQVAAAAIFTGRTVLAKRTLNSAYDLRVVKHVNPDGKQPHELARTKAMNYSIYNFNALAALGNMAVLNGVKRPYWSESEDSPCLLRLAAEFICDFVRNPDKYPDYKDLDPVGARGSLVRVMYLADSYFPERGYTEQVVDLIKDDMAWRVFPLR